MEISKRSGTKGGLPDFWSENEVRQLFGDHAFEKMREAGLEFSVQPVLCAEQVMEWGHWRERMGAKPPKVVPLSVDPVTETLTYKGKDFDFDRTLALVLKCLIDANGEIRSTSDIKKMFPDEPWEERLDVTIKRRLAKHPSGVGDLVESVSKRGYRFRIEACE